MQCPVVRADEAISLTVGNVLQLELSLTVRILSAQVLNNDKHNIFQSFVTAQHK